LDAATAGDIRKIAGIVDRPSDREAGHAYPQRELLPIFYSQHGRNLVAYTPARASRHDWDRSCSRKRSNVSPGSPYRHFARPPHRHFERSREICLVLAHYFL